MGGTGGAMGATGAAAGATSAAFGGGSRTGGGADASKFAKFSQGTGEAEATYPHVPACFP